MESSFCLEEAPFTLGQNNQAFLEGYCRYNNEGHIVPKVIIQLLFQYIYAIYSWTINFTPQFAQIYSSFYENNKYILSRGDDLFMKTKIFTFDIFTLKAKIDFDRGVHLSFKVVDAPIDLFSALFRVRYNIYFDDLNDLTTNPICNNISHDMSCLYNNNVLYLPYTMSHHTLMDQSIFQSLLLGKKRRIKFIWNFELINIKYKKFDCMQFNHINFHKLINFAKYIDFKCDLSGLLNSHVTNTTLIFKKYLDHENWSISFLKDMSDPLPKIILKFSLLQFPAYVKRFKFSLAIKCIINGNEFFKCRAFHSRTEYNASSDLIYSIYPSDIDRITSNILVTGKLFITKILYFDDILVEGDNLLGNWV